MANEKPTNHLLQYGQKEPLPEKVPLRAGALSLVYENGFIRYIKAGEHEVLRMINHAVRDHNWGTMPLRIVREQIRKKTDSFVIDYQAEAKQGALHFLWDCRIEGRPDSSITFTIEGKALSEFRRNRIGFTVLHPVKECAGKEVFIGHPNGTSDQHRFPELISPHQPFFNIRKMEWKLADRGTARLEFSGDIFETEDQRNWIDDSFKTYCTPLALPFPVALKQGDQVKQAITLSFEGTGRAQPADPSPAYSFSLEPEPAGLPLIGVGRSTEVSGFTGRELALLKALPLNHYQVDIKVFEEDWRDQWQRALQEAIQLDLLLELSLFFNKAREEVPAIVPELTEHGSQIDIVNIFNKSPHATQMETLNAVLPELRQAVPKARIGAGTNAFFTELNRDRTPADQLDFVVYSINPQIHAFDNGTLVENLNAIPYTVKTARAFSEGKPVHISPITFKMRWNPNATGKKVTLPGQMPEEVDVRQMSLFGASWVLGCINSLMAAGVRGATFFETIGLKGIIQSSNPEFSDRFPAEAGSAYPMYLVLKTILSNRAGEFFPVHPSEPLVFSGLAYREKDGKSRHLLLGNFSGDRISIQLPENFQNREIQVVNAENIAGLMERPEKLKKVEKYQVYRTVELPPYGLGWLR